MPGWGWRAPLRFCWAAAWVRRSGRGHTRWDIVRVATLAAKRHSGFLIVFGAFGAAHRASCVARLWYCPAKRIPVPTPLARTGGRGHRCVILVRFVGFATRGRKRSIRRKSHRSSPGAGLLIRHSAIRVEESRYCDGEHSLAGVKGQRLPLLFETAVLTEVSSRRAAEARAVGSGDDGPKYPLARSFEALGIPTAGDEERTEPVCAAVQFGSLINSR